jgi:DNA-binding MarR family transcriptional regulator
MLRAADVVANGDGAPARDSLAERLGRAWRELRRGAATGVLVDQIFGRHGEPDSVEPGHLDVLDILSDRDGQRMSDLALALHVDPSTVTRTMHRMETAGLARRAAFERDGRVVTAHLTDEGRRLHALVAARRRSMIETAFEDLTPDERVQLVELLERFLEAVNRNTTGRERPAG